MVYSVSQLNIEIRQLLEQGFGQISLVGEISNFAAPGSGHWYFTLKDERAQVRCAMFRNANQRAKVRPQNGMQVLVRAKVTVYEPRGDYQLIIEQVEDAGQGLLQQRYEQLKEKLSAEGLFATERKRSLPDHIHKVGVLTSPTGAAIKDILAVMKRRDPSVEVIIYPSAVQGEAAVPQLQSMLKMAFERNEVDVLLVSRGGGSLEDLWCFNDENFARLLATAPMPTISAVGHEIDFTISDFVADVRAPTPSAAAELVTRDQQQQRQKAQALQQRLVLAQQRLLQRLKQRWQFLQTRLQQQHPQRQLQQQSQLADELQARAYRALQNRLARQQQRVSYLQGRLQAVHPQKELQRLHEKLNHQQQRLPLVMQRLLKENRARQQQLMQSLNLVSPLNTLERGYAIVRTENGEVVRSEKQVDVGGTIEVRLADGSITAKRQ
ncbi:MAG: exodeoxyribonuclease VII large subunit [Pseudomonadota bacterium]